MNPKKILVVVAASSALVAVPVAPAVAKGGGDRPAKAQKKLAKQQQKLAKRCAKQNKVGFKAQGSLAVHDLDSVSLTVTKANKHARRWLGTPNEPTFALAGAKLAFEGVTDANGNGIGLDDVVGTDRVRVIGKLSVPKRGCDGEAALTVRKVAVNREVEEEAPESGTTPA